MSRSPTYEPPFLAEHVVSRPRVVGALVERISRHPLVQVVAPAGSGKTTAVAQAVGDLDRSVTWLTIEEWHRAPAKLLDGLLQALEHVAPGLTGEVTRARAEDVELRELAALAGSFVHRQHAVLVVDDCHLVQDSAEAVSALAAPLMVSAFSTVTVLTKAPSVTRAPPHRSASQPPNGRVREPMPAPRKA